QQLARSGLALWRYWDAATQFGMQRQWLDPLAGALLLLGLGYALIHLRRPGVALVLLWGLGYVGAGAPTLGPPAYQRLLGMALSAALLSGLALDRALSHLPSGRVWGALALVLGLGLALLSGARNWTDYLNWASDPRTAGVRMQVVHFLESQP